jgi:hypothetical protein
VEHDPQVEAAAVRRVDVVVERGGVGPVGLAAGQAEHHVAHRAAIAEPAARRDRSGPRVVARRQLPRPVGRCGRSVAVAAEHEHRQGRGRGRRGGRRQRPAPPGRPPGAVDLVERPADPGAQERRRRRRGQALAQLAQHHPLAVDVRAAGRALEQVQLDVTLLLGGQLAVAQHHRQRVDVVAQLEHGQVFLRR